MNLLLCTLLSSSPGADALPDVDDPPGTPGTTNASAGDTEEGAAPEMDDPPSDAVRTSESSTSDHEIEDEPAPQSGRDVPEPIAVEAPPTATVPVTANRRARQPDFLPSPEAIARTGNVDLSTSKSTAKLYRPSGSPQRFAMEIKFGPYLPEVDRGYQGEGLGPYARVFGRTDDLGIATDDPRAGLMSVLSFEWQFFYLAGPFSIGLQAGFFRDTARALVDDPGAGEAVRSEADSVSFSVVPLAVLAGYRFEMLADRWRVPLVPYFRTGLNYAFWWSRDGSGDISRNADGEKGHGGTWGWQINPGLMLRMDFLEPGTAKKLDLSTGINHTYLFGEYQLARIAGFGQDAAMQVGDSTWLVGLAVEF